MLRTPAERYTLADEAKILEAYIHIMEVRYSGSFSFRCAFSPESLACRLPKLLPVSYTHLDVYKRQMPS